MMASADVDGDGLINYEEFLKIMVKCALVLSNVFILSDFFLLIDTLQGQWPKFILNQLDLLQFNDYPPL
jgi:hypothetical protein